MLNTCSPLIPVEWIAEDSEQEASILCQSNPVIKECPQDFVQVGDSCYSFQTTRMYWTDAQAFCGDLHQGGHLAEFKEPEEFGILLEYMRANQWTATSGDSTVSPPLTPM